jgi:RimJ/RimL family protein N-acetyltransferase
MMAFGFTELGLHRISARCVAENVASARVLEKLGMRLEGRQRDKAHFKGRHWDTLLFAIRAEDWRPSPIRA